MDTVIKVENISKQYRLGKVGLGTVGADINRWYQTSIRGKEDPFLKIGEENDRSVKGESDYVWALRNINFEVKQGEVLGIIGRNGAGKSTLLKILSRTTTPTIGQIKIKGRVASLLEVGTGFHPELTGRENIFLNGAILGMSRKEIKRKFDEIIDFSGVERYIDTPVKRYSSGMYVRLAFGVAAHLEPEILIVDEVLAVGDAEFQKKAIGKMQDVSTKDGRTVLFVSHNMGVLKSICSRGILLCNGKVEFENNEIEKVVSRYYHTTDTEVRTAFIKDRTDRVGDGSVFIEQFQLINANKNQQLELGKPISFRITYHSKADDLPFKFLISINSFVGDCVVFLDSSVIPDFPSHLDKSGNIEIKLSQDFGLPLGTYFVNIAVMVENRMADYVVNAIKFEVVDGLFYHLGKVPSGKGACFIKQEWVHQPN
jgi:lipopolysaccharide transport system ATP-binding protein